MRVRFLLPLVVAGLAAGGVALAMPAIEPPLLDPAVRADRIVVDKSERTLSLLAGATVLKTYRVALGSGGLAPKRREGDALTPEGRYTISGRNPNSAYHLSLRISYPSRVDRAAAKALGVPPGGDIMIHGLPNGMGALGAAHRLRDWTLGCIAVTNEEIEEIWRAVPNGTPIEILP